LVRAIQDPPLVGFGGYASYLVYGICLATEPDWVLAVEADFLISPREAEKLRKALIESSPAMELVMAKAVNLNYDGTKKLHCPDFKKWYTPFDGYTWDRPIGCRPRLGMFPAPFNGISRENVQVNCEGYICLRPGKWGTTFNSKFLNNNPNGFQILRTDCQFEHLQFSRSPQSLITKLSHPYWIQCQMGIRKVLAGSEPYPIEYQELTEIKSDYAQHIEHLLTFVG
jgi:hypothetical protein